MASALTALKNWMESFSGSVQEEYGEGRHTYKPAEPAATKRASVESVEQTAFDISALARGSKLLMPAPSKVQDPYNKGETVTPDRLCGRITYQFKGQNIPEGKFQVSDFHQLTSPYSNRPKGRPVSYDLMIL